MKILLLGKNGQLGWELQRALAPLGVVVASVLPLALLIGGMLLIQDPDMLMLDEPVAGMSVSERVKSVIDIALRSSPTRLH